jgi:hypothetical protein
VLVHIFILHFSHFAEGYINVLVHILINHVVDEIHATWMSSCTNKSLDLLRRVRWSLAMRRVRSESAGDRTAPASLHRRVRVGSVRRLRNTAEARASRPTAAPLSIVAHATLCRVRSAGRRDGRGIVALPMCQMSRICNMRILFLFKSKTAIPTTICKH